MDRSKISAVFKHLNGLWPKWGANKDEQQEWGRIFEKMDEQTARTAISEFYQEYGRYDRPPVPDFLTVARRVERFKLSQKKGITVQVKRARDGYCQTITIYGTQDHERIMTEACKFRDYLQGFSEDWQVIRPEALSAG
jgi:hypothetical protein